MRKPIIAALLTAFIAPVWSCSDDAGTHDGNVGGAPAGADSVGGGPSAGSDATEGGQGTVGGSSSHGGSSALGGNESAGGAPWGGCNLRRGG